MMYAVLSLGLALLGGIVRLAQVLRLSAPLLYGALVITVFRPWYLAQKQPDDLVVSASPEFLLAPAYRSGGRHFPCAGGSCGAVMGGDADSSGAGDDLVK